MLTHTQLQFFVLLRAGLWDKPVDLKELMNPEAYQANGNEDNDQAYQANGNEDNDQAYQANGNEDNDQAYQANGNEDNDQAYQANGNEDNGKERKRRKNKKNTESANDSQDSAIDWPAIYRISREQTVVGLIADAIGTLPKDQRPPMPMLQKIIMDKLAIERSHVQLNAVLNEVVQALNAEGIPHVLLKGQGVAQNYPHPTSRTCGDIDLYVGERNYPKANEIIKAFSDDPEAETEETIKHASFYVHGVDIEVHKMAATLDKRRSDEAFQEFTREELDAQMDRREGCTSLELWDNSGSSINLPSPKFNGIFQLIHMMRHLITGGIGLRQVCDWTRFLHNHKLKANDIAPLLRSFGLEKAWDGIASISINYLGMPQEEMPAFTTVNGNLAEKITRIIFTTGNFGHHDAASLKARDSRYVINKWKRFRYHIGYYFKILPLFPKLEMQYIGGWFVDGIKAFFRGLKRK